MKQVYSPFLSRIGMYALTFATVIFVVFILKGVPLSSNGLILDDMQYFYPSIYSDLSHLGTLFSFYSAINTLFYEPYLVRIAYQVVVALIAVMIYSFLVKVTKDKVSAYLLALLATFTPTSAITGLFINGSYNVPFLLFYLVGVAGQIKLYEHYPRLSVVQRVLIHLGATMAIAFSVQLTQNGMLLPLALAVLPWWRSELFLKHRKSFYLYVGSYAVLVLGSIFLMIVTTLDHPYAHMEGRLDYGLGSLILHAIELPTNVFNSYFVNSLSTGVLYDLDVKTLGFGVVVLLSVALVFVATMFVVSSAMRAFVKQRASLLLMGGFLLVFIVLCVGPLAPNVRIHLWHYYLPAAALALVVGLILYTFLPKYLFVGSVAALLILSIMRLAEQSTYYDSTFSGQDKFISHIHSLSSSWPDDSTVIVATRNIPFLSGFGQLNGVRDLNYLKFHSRNKSIRRAAIATPDTISSILKSDDVESTPVQLYRYSFPTGKMEEPQFLVVERGGVYNVYDTTQDGARLTFSGSEQAVARHLIKNELSSADAVYLRSGESRPGVDYSGEYISFDGDDDEIARRLDFSGTLVKASYEILFRSQYDGCKEIDSEQQRCPSMFLLSPPLAIYQSAVGKLRIQVKMASSEKYFTFRFDQNDWHKLRFSFNFHEETLSIFLNDEPFDTLDGVVVKQSLMRDVLLGKGYNQRFWKGDVAYFSIHGSSGDTSVKLLDILPNTGLKGG